MRQREKERGREREIEISEVLKKLLIHFVSDFLKI